jgi:hypothetical protein
MLYDLDEGCEGGDLIYETGLKAQGCIQILPSLSDQRPLPLHYPLTFMIQGCILLFGMHRINKLI